MNYKEMKNNKVQRNDIEYKFLASVSEYLTDAAIPNNFGDGFSDLQSQNYVGFECKSGIQIRVYCYQDSNEGVVEGLKTGNSIRFKAPLFEFSIADPSIYKTISDLYHMPMKEAENMMNRGLRAEKVRKGIVPFNVERFKAV